MITLIGNGAYGLIAPFLPLELKAMGISMDYFGYLFSMYSLPVVVASPIIGFLLTKFKKRSFV